MEENLENIELDLPVQELFDLMLMAHKEDKITETPVKAFPSRAAASGS